jgi:hypothetical protein
MLTPVSPACAVITLHCNSLVPLNIIRTMKKDSHTNAQEPAISLRAALPAAALPRRAAAAAVRRAAAAAQRRQPRAVL